MPPVPDMLQCQDQLYLLHIYILNLHLLVETQRTASDPYISFCH